MMTIDNLNDFTTSAGRHILMSDANETENHLKYVTIS